MKKVLALVLLVSAILASGCVSTTEAPVGPEDLIVSTEPLVIKEFQEQDVSVIVFNNNSKLAIDSVSISSFDPFTIVGPGSMVNIPAGKQATLNFKVMAPALGVENSSVLVLSYASGIDEEEKPIIRTKAVPVETVVLSDARLQFVGFAESMEKLRVPPPVSTWAVERGGNVTVTFSVKNQGQSTISRESTYVLVDIENKMIGDNASFNINQSMAKGGTSYTRGLELPIMKDAPNGETNVYVNLYEGEYLLDFQTLVLKVKL